MRCVVGPRCRVAFSMQFLTEGEPETAFDVTLHAIRTFENQRGPFQVERRTKKNAFVLLIKPVTVYFNKGENPLVLI